MSLPAPPVSRLFRSMFGVVAIIVAALSLCATPRAQERLEPLTIVTSTGAHEFKVEVARTMQERAKGLMFRRSMPQDQGMIFDFGLESPIAMWMKNTYIPLDMIFLSRHGLVTNVAPDATPFSEAVISSGGPAYAVIELNAGVARQIGLAPGDRVRHKMFGN